MHTSGVTLNVVHSRRTSAGSTPPSSLLRTHAPIRNTPYASVLPLCARSLLVAVSPSCESDLPDVISANLSPHVWTPTPAASRVLLPVSSPRALAFAALGPARRFATSPTATSVRTLISVLQSFDYLQTCGFARHPNRSYPHTCRRGSCGFYVHAYLGLLPPRAVDMLTVQIGQLTVSGLSPN